MQRDVIFSSEHVIITKMADGFYIESFKAGMTVDQFNKLMTQHPEIKISSFMAIKNALLFPPKPPTKFGDVKERVSIEISGDELKAYVTLCVMEYEFIGDAKVALIKEVLRKLGECGVVFGVKQDVLLNHLCNNKQLLIAEGIPPENGEDSKVRMYELKDPKPEVKEDGNVDHYELNLINRVNEGDWLGERTDPTPGTPGKSVKGNPIVPLPGKKYPLVYDKNTVKEVVGEGITTLYAAIHGAVHYSGDKIGVSNHLEITGNIDFKTGNVDFDGYLTVKGSVEDSFSVVADKDIEILGVYGVGSVREIVSREGRVYIKGGIAGKNKAVVKSRKDIYTKFVSDATIICEGSVHIGFYCLNSNIQAKEVILESPKGQIIGGKIEAEIKVISSIFGSASEKRTHIIVKGFDREVLKERLEKLITKIEHVKGDLTRCKQEISIYSNTNSLTREQHNAYERLKERFYEVKDDLKSLEDDRKSLVSYLRTKGEGEVSILKKAYPNTLIEIKKNVKEIDKVVIGLSYYVQDSEMKEL
ncbi:MAG: FapA family protein [Clostridia bacterium]|nr:FapA family protein [Clostridia bacterium]